MKRRSKMTYTRTIMRLYAVQIHGPGSRRRKAGIWAPDALSSFPLNQCRPIPSSAELLLFVNETDKSISQNTWCCHYNGKWASFQKTKGRYINEINLGYWETVPALLKKKNSWETKIDKHAHSLFHSPNVHNKWGARDEHLIQVSHTSRTLALPESLPLPPEMPLSRDLESEANIRSLI